MSENIFIEKFQHKTDSELEYILENKKNYNEQAIAASIHILKERNGKTPELESVENEIKIEKKKKEVAREKIIEEDKKKDNITDDPNAPELHSKKVIMVFSGLFSTIFGAVLLMYNMKQTDNQNGRIQVLIFGILYTIITLVVVNLLNIGGNIALIFNIAGGGILTEYFWNKFIGKEFEHRKRSWVKPAIISVLITIPLILAAIYGQ
ncbi:MULTISPECIES: hypothetical protein [Winogradskyella]|uniref:hypothetical protein n=1 Tax=Winogradskyella TaxID=286104 RepID=UPI0015C98A35|nr:MULTISPECIES: hypothetical protein [Winogradskyella]QXP78713.1 hypothetical protein H0I32_16140 [Winogradskyella sp. HaHa_3_26]